MVFSLQKRISALANTVCILWSSSLGKQATPQTPGPPWRAFKAPHNSAFMAPGTSSLFSVGHSEERGRQTEVEGSWWHLTGAPSCPEASPALAAQNDSTPLGRINQPDVLEYIHIPLQMLKRWLLAKPSGGEAKQLSIFLTLKSEATAKSGAHFHDNSSQRISSSLILLY